MVVGIANEHSLAWAAAQHFRSAGAELAITYRNDKPKPSVELLARKVEATIFRPFCRHSFIQMAHLAEPLMDQEGA